MGACATTTASLDGATTPVAVNFLRETTYDTATTIAVAASPFGLTAAVRTKN